MPTATLSIRIPAATKRWLGRLALVKGQSPSATASRLLEEAVRMEQFSGIVFRDTPLGRQAFVEGSRMKVWEIVHALRQCKNSFKRLAADFPIPEWKLRAAQNYATAFPKEVADAIELHQSLSVQEVRAEVPQLEVFKRPR